MCKDNPRPGRFRRGPSPDMGSGVGFSSVSWRRSSTRSVLLHHATRRLECERRASWSRRCVTLSYIGHRSLVSRALDHLDYLITYTRPADLGPDLRTRATDTGRRTARER